MLPQVKPADYPKSKASDTKEERFGVAVADPYRWLEDPKSEETKEWVDQQAKFATSFLSKLPHRDEVRKRLDEVNNYEKRGCPFERAGKYYIFHNSGLQNQSVLYELETPDQDVSKGRVLLDVNKEYPDGVTAVSSYAISEDGKYLAYGLSKGGSDWKTIYVREVATGKDLDDAVPWVKFSGISWTKDNKGFFYSRYPTPAGVKSTLRTGSSKTEEKEEKEEDGGLEAGMETAANVNHMVYFHRVGTSADDDAFVFRDDSSPQDTIGSEVSDDGKYLFMSVHDGCAPRNKLFVALLPDPADADATQAWAGKSEPLKVLPLVTEYKASFDYVANNGAKGYFQSNLDSPMYKVVQFTLPEWTPDQSNTLESVPEDQRGPIDYVPAREYKLDWATSTAHDKILLCFVKDVASRLEIISMEDPSSPEVIELPGIGTVQAISSRAESSTFFYKYVSFLSPGVTVRCQVKAKADPKLVESNVIHETEVAGFKAEEFTTFQNFAVSTDGTKIPYFVIRRKGDQGPSPAVLYGYGGFSISLTPSFSSSRLVWLNEFSGAYVVANIRGGDEYGEDWHTAAIKTKRQVAFDDFISVARDLEAQKISSAAQIATLGGSNGGLLTLTTALQAPTAMKAAVAMVPVADMLRFHKFTIGHAWCSDYGNSEANEEEFKALIAYSPLHNVKTPESSEKNLPAILITTGDHDDRVVPLHSFKMTATLQETAGRSEHQVNPLVCRIEQQTGHGAGKPLSKTLDEVRDVYCFIAAACGAKYSSQAE